MANDVQKKSDMQKLNVLASTIISRSKTAALLGKTFGNKRDLYAALGYNRSITIQEYRERAERSIAKRIVNAFPQATWRNSPIVTENGQRAGDSSFAQEFQQLAIRTKLFHYLERADKLAGVGSYGILMLGVRASGQLKDPLRGNKNRNPDDLMFLSAFLEESAGIQDYEIDPTNPRFGMPKTYNIDLMGSLSNYGVSQVTKPSVPSVVHHSRIIHIAEELGEDEIFGQPRLMAVWNYLDDLDKIMGGSAEAFWRVIDRGIQFDVDKDAMLDSEEEADLVDEIEEYMHGFKRYLRTRGIKANVLGSDAPDPSDAVNTVMSLISGTTGIPKRVLLGSEVGQLASTQDDKNFNMRVRERQTSFAEPQILRPFIDRLMEYGLLPKVEYEVIWPDLSMLTEKERADVAARSSQAAKNFKEALGESPISKEEIRLKYFDLPSDFAEGEEPKDNSEDLTIPANAEDSPEDVKTPIEQ